MNAALPLNVKTARKYSYKSSVRGSFLHRCLARSAAGKPDVPVRPVRSWGSPTVNPRCEQVHNGEPRLPPFPLPRDAISLGAPGQGILSDGLGEENLCAPHITALSRPKDISHPQDISHRLRHIASAGHIAFYAAGYYLRFRRRKALRTETIPDFADSCFTLLKEKGCIMPDSKFRFYSLVLFQ